MKEPKKESNAGSGHGSGPELKSGSVPREIAKIPETPQLSEALVTALTELCFAEDPLERADLLLVFGSNTMQEDLAKLIGRLLEQGLAKTVIITGGIANYLYTRMDGIPESEVILSHIPTRQFPEVRFLTETHSRNSLENVLEAQKIHPFKKEESIIFLSHAHASGRSRLTLKKICPGNKLISHPYEVPMGPGKELLRRSDWWKHSQGKAMVWGEFLRFLKYGERGDIPIDDKVKGKIGNIKRLSNL